MNATAQETTAVIMLLVEHEPCTQSSRWGGNIVGACMRCKYCMVASLLGQKVYNTGSKLPIMNYSCLFSPGPVGEEVTVGSTKLQVTPRGLGVHWPSLSHTAVISPSGTNPGSHWNTTTEPSVVLVWGCSRDPLTGGGGAPQLAVGRIEVTVKMASYQCANNMHLIFSTSWFQNRNSNVHALASWNIATCPDLTLSWDKINDHQVEYVRGVYMYTKFDLSMQAVSQKSHAILTWFPTLLCGWVRSPGHVGTHCTHLCPWNQPWTAAVGYGGPFCYTLEVVNGPSVWRSWLHTASYKWLRYAVKMIHVYSPKLIPSDDVCRDPIIIDLATFKISQHGHSTGSNAVSSSNLYSLSCIVW